MVAGVVLYKNSNIQKEYAIQNRSNDTINLIKCFCFYLSCASNFARHNFFQCIPGGATWFPLKWMSEKNQMKTKHSHKPNGRFFLL